MSAPPDRLKLGIRLFNDREFFECHEILEDEWRAEGGPRRRFLQSLIHIAVAFVHMQRGNPIGARGQLRKGLLKLENSLYSCEKIDTARLQTDALTALARIESGMNQVDYPRIYLR